MNLENRTLFQNLGSTVSITIFVTKQLGLDRVQHGVNLSLDLQETRYWTNYKKHKFDSVLFVRERLRRPESKVYRFT
jgi:hypothetical protein